MTNWQGKGGTNDLLIWRQLIATPLHNVGDFPNTYEELSKDMLPDGELNIYTSCGCGLVVDAVAIVSGGIWKTTMIHNEVTRDGGK